MVEEILTVNSFHNKYIDNIAFEFTLISQSIYRHQILQSAFMLYNRHL